MKKLNLILFLVMFSLKSNEIDKLLKQYPNVYDGIPKEYLTDEVKQLLNDRFLKVRNEINALKLINEFCDQEKQKKAKDFITSMFTAPECLNDPYFITENVSDECSNLRKKSSIEFLKNNISFEILFLKELAIFNLNIITNKDGIYTKHIWRLGFFECLYNQSKRNKQN